MQSHLIILQMRKLTLTDHRFPQGHIANRDVQGELDEFNVD